MTKNKCVPLSARTIENLNSLAPNHKYALSWNEDGEITSLTVLEVMTSTKPYEPETGIVPKSEMDKLIADILNSTKSGSMVMAFNDLDNEPKMANPLGQGYILYLKKPIVICDGVEDVLRALYTARKDAESGLVIRYKRRQGKWLLFVGDYLDALPEGFEEKMKGNDNVRLYSLVSRCHIALLGTTPESE